MSKRQKFVIVTAILLAGIILSRMGLGVFLQWRFRVILMALFSWLATVWAIRDEDFSGVEWVTLPILPALFSLGSVLAYPLLPEILGSGDSGLLLALLLKLVFLAMFIIGYYASLLTANIYNVAAIRTIQLLRVAHSIGFLVTVATGLMFFLVISALHMSGMENFLLIFAVTLPLAFQAIWSVGLEAKIGEEVRNFSLLTAVVLAEIGWALSFWPLGVSIFALFLTAILYELVGIIQFHLGEKLNPRIANEFIVVAILIFFLTIFTAQWGA